jgi:hypothetical protein
MPVLHVDDSFVPANKVYDNYLYEWRDKEKAGHYFINTIIIIFTPSTLH